MRGRRQRHATVRHYPTDSRSLSADELLAQAEHAIIRAAIARRAQEQERGQ